MKLITRNTDYAVRAIIFIAGRKSGIVSATELVRELKIPRPFLRKILQALNKKRILRSYKGQGGGFSLALEPHKIYLADLMEAFQGPLKLNECIFKKKVCPNRAACALNSRISAIERQVASQIKSINIASLLNGEDSYGKEKNN